MIGACTASMRRDMGVIVVETGVGWQAARLGRLTAVDRLRQPLDRLTADNRFKRLPNVRFFLTLSHAKCVPFIAI